MTMQKLMAIFSVAVITAMPGVAQLTWDANDVGANQTDGAGGWLDVNHWWDGVSNVTWTPDSDAVFGNGGNGGAVSLASPTSVGSLTFNAFNGTYTLGTFGNPITVNDGITVNAGAGAVTLNSQIILGGSQTWTNNGGALGQSTANNATLDLGAFDLTVDGTGSINLNRAVISGTGGIIKNGSGRLNLGANPAAAHTFSGDLVLNGGVTITHNLNMGTGNLTLNGGIIELYWSYTLTKTLGAGPGQVQILGGVSGFSENGSTGMTVRLNNNDNFVPVWGSAFFNPSTFVLQSQAAQNNSTLTFNNGIDLNGATRMIASYKTSNSADTTKDAIILRPLVNSAGTPSGLIKTGAGMLRLNGANTYDGLTVIEAGTLGIMNALGLQNSVFDTANSIAGTSTSGLLTNQSSLTLGGLVGDKNFSDVFRTAGGGYSGLTALTLNVGASQSLTYAGTIANGAGSMALTKSGGGTQVLSADLIHSGLTTVSGGVLTLTGDNSGMLGGVTVAGSGHLNIGHANALGFGLLSFQGTGGATIDNLTGADLTLPTNNSQTWNGNVTFVGTHDLNLGFGSVNLAGNSMITVAGGRLATEGSIDESGGARSLSKDGPGTLTLNALTSYTGDTTIHAGVLEIGTNGGLGFGFYSGNLSIASTDGGSFIYDSTQDQTMLGEVSGDGTIVKKNSSVLNFGGNNTHTGTITVEDGTLLITGTHTPGGLITINADGTLGGSGSAPDVTIANGGTLAPGESAGTLQIANLTLSTSSRLEFELGAANQGSQPPDSDSVIVNGFLTLAGQFHFSALPSYGSPSLGSSWVLFEYQAGLLTDLGPSIASTPAGYSFEIDTSSSPGQVLLVVTKVPEPSSIIFAVFGAFLLFRVRRGASRRYVIG